jgi:hypothetical protein
MKEAILFCIEYKLMEEFKKQDLHIKYQKEIAEWFNYLDQQEFGRKLEKQMLQEIDRYMAGKETIEELMEKIFVEPKWEIEFLEKIPYNYVFKSILEYA